MAVSIYIKLPAGGEERGRGYWKINTQLLQDDSTKASFREEWAKCEE
jgi:hypothetical protein